MRTTHLILGHLLSEMGCLKAPCCPYFSDWPISLVSALHSNEKSIIHFFFCLVSLLKIVNEIFQNHTVL